MRFLQPKHPQIGPAGDGPRIVLAAQSGMGKSSAAAVLFKAYLPIVERAYIISSTLHLDPAYQEPMRLLKEKYKGVVNLSNLSNLSAVKGRGSPAVFR